MRAGSWLEGEGQPTNRPSSGNVKFQVLAEGGEGGKEENQIAVWARHWIFACHCDRQHTKYGQETENGD